MACMKHCIDVYEAREVAMYGLSEVLLSLLACFSMDLFSTQFGKLHKDNIALAPKL